MIYKHKVQYYETDSMAIVHHSNYIRWMEETRVDFLEKIGAPLSELEKLGLTSPVLEISCKYEGMTKFGDVVAVDARLKEFGGVKMVVSYVMRRESDGGVCFTAESRHCWLKDGRIINMRKKFPEVYEKFLPHIDKDI